MVARKKANSTSLAAAWRPKAKATVIEHLHALRHDVVEGDVVGKAAEAEVFVGQSEMVRDAVGDGLRGERVDQVPDAVGPHDHEAHGRKVLHAARAAPTGFPRGRRGNRRDPEKHALMCGVEKQQEKYNQALHHGAESEHDLERRGPAAVYHDTKRECCEQRDRRAR